MKINNLLIIGNSYRYFLKDLTETYHNNFDKIYFFLRYNPVAELSDFIPNIYGIKNHLEHLKRKSLIDLTDKPKNIEIILTPLISFPFDFEFKKAGEKNFRSIDKIITANNIKFDLIHAHFTWPAGYAGAKLKEKYNKPFIVTAHGYDIYDLPFRDPEWREKIEYVLNTADQIITVSNSNLKSIRKLNIASPVTVIPNGFKSSLFHPIDTNHCRQILGLPVDKKIILTIGNLVEVKGHQYLIDAIFEVVKDRKDILCVVIGSGRLKVMIDKKIKDAGLSNFITLAGGKNHNEIPLWINACDIFVLPSLNEGNPAVMFECLGCGKPFIGTNVGGIPEIIISEDYGFLCKPQNTQELAENILKAFNKEWDHNKILKYAEQFEWGKISEQIIGVYYEI